METLCETSGAGSPSDQICGAHIGYSGGPFGLSIEHPSNYQNVITYTLTLSYYSSSLLHNAGSN